MSNDDVKRVARAICRVLLNGGDPDQPAARWNGTEIELQSFPAWRDYRDEARAAIAALEAAGWRKIETDEMVVSLSAECPACGQRHVLGGTCYTDGAMIAAKDE